MKPTIRFDRLDPDAAVYTLTRAEAERAADEANSAAFDALFAGWLDVPLSRSTS